MSRTGIYARKIDGLDAIVQIGIATGRVISVSFPDESDPEAASAHEILDWIEAYLDRRHRDVTDVEIGLTVPTDQRAVLERVRKIPYGEDLSLERVVARSPGLDPEVEDVGRTARTALSENPVPLFVPDHRVSDVSGSTPPAIRNILRDVEGI